MRQTMLALAGAGAILAATAGQTLAYDCMVANKPVGAGSAATLNVDTGTVTPNKPNPGPDERLHGGFITITGTLPDGTAVTADTFVHAPATARAPFAEPGVVPGASKQDQQGKGCDGKGLDTAEACFGVG